MKCFGTIFFSTTILFNLDRIIVYFDCLFVHTFGYCSEIRASGILNVECQKNHGCEGKRHFQTLLFRGRAAKALSSLIRMRAENKDGQ